MKQMLLRTKLLYCIINYFPLTEDGNTLAASIPPEGIHPLTTSENDVYDNANSLQVRL